MRYLRLFARSSTTRRPARARRAPHPTHRRARLEPLEERRLLSLASPDELPQHHPVGMGDDNVGDMQASLEAAPDAGSSLTTAAEQTAEGWLIESVRVSVWTEQLITDLPAWVHSQQWPEWMTDVWVEGEPMEGLAGTVRVKELLHMPLWQDPRGGYRTILGIDGGFEGVTVEALLRDFEQLEFVDFAKLKSESVFRYTDRLQESIDAVTKGGSDAPLYLPGEQVVQATPIEVRVTFWTEERITDVRAFVEAQPWPEGLGPVEPESVKQLISIPVRSEPRGGYLTVVVMPVFSDLSALEELDFVEHARLESESVVQYGPRAQEAIDAMTNGGTPGETWFHIFGAPSGVEPIRMRVAFWTEERITNVGAFVEAQSWPEALGPVAADNVEQLVSIPLRQDPRGGYRTIVLIDVFGDITALEEVEFVDYAKLESQSVIQFGPNAQEAIDAMTNRGTPGETWFHIFGEPNRAEPIRMRVALRTEDRIADVGTFMESQPWPDALGPVAAENVRQLVSIPMRSSNSGGGYRTIVTMDVFGDISALEDADFVDYAKLESESVVQFGADSQKAIDAMARTAKRGETYFHLFLEESAELVGVNTFRDDERFEGMDGAGLAVAILDTGIDMDHPFFGDRIVYDWDYVNDDDDADDDHGHGTHVSSIAASEDGTYTGMAPSADLVALKVGNADGDVDLAHVEDALTWVVEHADEFDIVSVNMSFGGGNYDAPVTSIMSDELETLVQQEGVVVVSASGNSFHSYGDAQGVAYPSADPNSLSVGAVYDADEGRQPPPGYTYGDGSYANTTDADRIVPFSQRDDELTTLMAPGAVITAAAMGGGVTDMSGTSMAAPHIAGMAVLAQQLAMDELGQQLTQEQFVTLLQETGTTVNDGDDEDDNVDNTDLDFARADMFALGEAILDLHWHVTADDDPGAGAANDGSDDYFEISRVDDTLQITINGNALPARNTDEVIRITLDGSSDRDTLRVRSLGADFAGNVVLNGSGASAGDIAHLYDSPGNDAFTAWPASGEFQMEDAYFLTADNVEDVSAYSWNGGVDSAVLNDSTSNDTLEGFAAFARLRCGQSLLHAQAFEFVQAWAFQGGLDKAYLYDSDGNDDFFAWWSYAARLRDNAGTYNNRVRGFDEVYAYAENGGTDRAYLYDDAGGDDTFTAYPTWAQREGTGFLNYAEAFDQVYAVPDEGQHGGNDSAYLYDDPEGDDTFCASPTLAKLYGDGFSNQASSFAQVLAYSGLGHGFDIAALYDDPAGDDIFKAWPTLGKLYGAGFYNQASSFAQVHAYSGVGHGFDVAALYDDDAGNDVFRAWPDQAKLYGNGFYNRAKSFAQVHAYSGVGHGDDLAQLYDDDGGNDTFRAWPTEAKLYGNGFYNRAKSFRTVYGYAEQASGGTDVGYLYDSTGDDYLQARDGDPGGEDWIMLRDAADAVYAIRAYGLDEIWADSGTGDDDTADVGDNLDFLLHLTGVWENH